jgi:methylated-DNA-[protein]-cysteine S-methyltransferase
LITASLKEDNNYMENKILFYAIFQAESGWIGLSGSSEGLARTTLPQKSREKALADLGITINEATHSPEYFQELVQKFQAFLAGSRVDFDEKLDFSQATPFQREVWEMTRLIHYSETRSYSWVARQIGNPLAARAVGHALGKNPWPIVVPCHRVLGSNGLLCGFGGGLEMKRYLLDLENKGKI